MKRFIVPSLLLAAVFCITLFCQSFTIMRQESLGLFINTPDFYRELFLDPLPISNLIGSFLVQFYANHFLGSAIVAVMVLLCYLLLKGAIGRFVKYSGIIASALACAAWWFIARAHHPSTGVFIVLLSFLLWFICRLASKRSCRTFSENASFSIAVSSLTIFASALLICFNPGVAAMEKYAKVEYAASDYNWNFLLRIVTPEAASMQSSMVPYALLALNAKGELTEKISGYPLSKDFGLDFGDDQSYSSYHFKSVLYSTLGCPNEAVHNLHQSGLLLPHGTSFRTLRMLVQSNYSLSDSLMVVKYCDILDRSCTNKRFVKFFRDNPCPQKDYNTASESSLAPMIKTHDQMGNMLQLEKAGLNSDMAMERYAVYFGLLN